MRLIFLIPFTVTFGYCFTYPYQVRCPEFSLVRQGCNKLSLEEEEYVKQKASFTSKKLYEYLKSVKENDLLLETRVINSFMESPPIIGLAISGGGYRSMLTATGILKEMNSVGLFETLTYISGLSGGSWVLLDLILHDYDPDLLLEFWDLETGILEGIPNFDVQTADITGDISGNYNQSVLVKRNVSCRNETQSTIIPIRQQIFQKRGGFPFVGNLKNKILPGLTSTNPKKASQVNSDSKLLSKISDFYLNIHFKLRKKKLAGFQLSFTDYWGRALLQRANNKSTLLKRTSFYDLINTNDRFAVREAPIPIFIANCRNKGLKNFIFEFTPFEFGSWEKSGQVFIKLKYLGSHIKNGLSEKCYRQFDDIGFITATSSSIFNNVIAFVWTKISQSSTTIVSTFGHFAKIFGMNNFDEILEVNTLNLDGNDTRMETDYAIFHPNPFFLYHKSNITASITSDNYLYLVDGGEDGENIPLRNLMVPARAAETLFIIDSSSDIHNYANGTKLLNVLEIMKFDGINYMPSENTSSLSKVKALPIVLGCNMKPTTSTEKVVPPILIYYQNQEKSFPSNMSTFKATYSKMEINGMLANAKVIFHGENNNNNLTFDTCLPCFILKRRLDFIFYSEEYPVNYSFCHQCFETFCLS